MITKAKIVRGWPRYFKERLWLGNVKTGEVAIATLWTAKEKIVAALGARAKSRVAVVGQLYSARGSEYIFRNIWANPRIRYLIVTGADLSGSGEILCQPERREERMTAWLPGVGKKEIRKFFKAVRIIDLRGRGVEKVEKTVTTLNHKGAFAKPKLFKEPRVKIGEYPSENSGFRIEGETIGEVWLQILKLIHRFGKRIHRIKTYGGYERDLLNVVSVISKEDIKNPTMWPFFEFGQEELKSYFSSFFSVRGEEAYTYGERLFAYEIDGQKLDQVTIMVKKMKSFPFNKGAMAILWQAGIDNFPIRKPWLTPCLTLVQGMCLGEKFFLTAYFRSNDMFGAWPENAFALRKLQTEIAIKIGKEVGELSIISSCAFIDESDLPRVEKILKENKRSFCRLDPRGDLLIEVAGREIVVKQLDSEGRVLGELREKAKVVGAAKRMAAKLMEQMVISDIGHALDIGEQLGRAEDAIALKKKFEQDKGLEETKSDKVVHRSYNW